ncbi:hypothetical protein IKQ26_08680 [bacterium]|nr:hypothetical protein [bacterium]
MNISKITSAQQQKRETVDSEDIKINTYDRTKEYKSVAPGEETINLNDYYNQGFTTDEQNKEERKVIRGDILSRYDIEEDDTQKDEKLVQIYSEILNNQEENSTLIDYCKSNNIEINSDKISTKKFNSGIETAMAHMSHDGTGEGDIIKLSNVDLSDFVPEIQLEASDNPRIIINGSAVLEFDDKITHSNGQYTGTINGQKVSVMQYGDAACSVKYFNKQGSMTKEIVYTPDALSTTTDYGKDGEIKSRYTSDEKGNKISEYKQYDNYGIETFNTDEGGYILYDKNGQVQYNITKTDNQDGTIFITKYADKARKNEISNDLCLKYQTQEGEDKYKFSTGNRYQVDFKTDGNKISANITRGSLKTTAELTINDNGTIQYKDKVFLSLDDAAVELNQTDIKPTVKADTDISVSKQGFGVGDCGLISAVNALSYTQLGQEVLNEALEYHEDGSLTINFYGLNRSYNITKDEIDNTDYFAQGDKDIIAVEIGLNKAYQDVVNGNIVIDDFAPYWCKTPGELTSEKFLITATWPQGVFHLLTGKECSIEDDIDRGTKSAWLDELQYNQGIAISCGTTRRDGSSILRTDTDSTYVSGITVSDAFGNPVGIVSDHAYAIKEVNSKPDGTRTLTIVNPWDSGDEIVLNEQTYLDNFDLNYAMQLRDNLNFPIYYYS